MDILHHTAIGTAGAMALTYAGAPVAGFAFLAGSVFPDGDIVTIVRGKVAYLLAHQGPSHSIFTGAAVAVLTGLAIGSGAGTAAGGLAAAGFFAGFLLHVLLDVSNTLGTRLLWPLPGRYRLDATFFVDLVSWGLTGATLALLAATREPWPAVAWVAAMVGQIWYRAALSRRACRETGYQIAIPDPFNPVLFHLTRRLEDGAVEMTSWSPGAGEITAGYSSLPAPSAEAVALARSEKIVRDMGRFARALSIFHEAPADDGSMTLVLRDAAMRRIGGDFGEIALVRSADGRTSHKIKL